MTDFLQEITEARTISDPADYIDRVKIAVRREFARIDESAELKDTHYFNHSAVPDFVIHWPDKNERQLYLRNSFESIVAGNDAVRFNRAKPMVVALTPNEAQSDRSGDIAAQSGDAPDTLIADSQALDTLAEFAIPVGDSQSGVSPVSTLVRANFARGGRGLLTSDRVTDLLSIGSTVDSEPQTSFIERLSRNFLPESIQTIARTVELVELSQRSAADGVGLITQVEQRLSNAELESVLPWILKNAADDVSEEFWKHLGSMLDFSDLFTIKEALTGVDLTGLVQANLSTWTGKRAYIGLESIASENASSPEILAREDGRWSLIGTTVGVNFSGSRLHVAHSGTALRGREGVSSTLWSELSGALAPFQVDSISLRGIGRSITVSAEESTDVSQDVDDIAETVDDTYYVKELGLAVPTLDDEESALLSVKFDNKLVTSDRPVPLEVLSLVALRVLLYRTPIDEATIDGLIGYQATSGDTLAEEHPAQDPKQLPAVKNDVGADDSGANLHHEDVDDDPVT